VPAGGAIPHLGKETERRSLVGGVQANESVHLDPGGRRNIFFVPTEECRERGETDHDQRKISGMRLQAVEGLEEQDTIWVAMRRLLLQVRKGTSMRKKGVALVAKVSVHRTEQMHVTIESREKSGRGIIVSSQKLSPESLYSRLTNIKS